MNKQTLALIAGALALATGGVFLGRALATGVPQPTPLTWAGVVTDQAGKPYPQAQDVTVGFWDKATGGTLLCKSATVQAEGGTGRFQATLPAECAAAVHATPDLWSEAVVGAGKAVMPRVKVGAVPYALEAAVASQAGGGLKGELDGLKKDLAAVKGGTGSGGGGPKVVDAKGVVVGALDRYPGGQDYSYPAGGQNSLRLILRVITSAGAHVEVATDGVFPTPSWASLYFKGKNCTGDVLLKPEKVSSFSGSGPILNSATRYSAVKGSFYRVAGPINGVSPIIGSEYGSFEQPSGLCDNNVGQQNPSGWFWQLQPVTTAELGIPDNLTPPLTIAP